MRVLATIVLLATVAPATAGAPRRAGLVVWPARTTIGAGTAGTLHIANHTRRPIALSVRVIGLALDLRGTPRLVPSSAGTSLLLLGRRRVVIAGGATGTLGVRAVRRSGLPPGDRPALVLLTARSSGGAGIGVQARIGVPVEVRVPGIVRRRLEVGPLHVRGRRLELMVRNRGNVDERLERGSVVLELWRGLRRLGTLQPRARDLLPHARGLVAFRVPRGIRGRVRIVARVARPPGGRRSFVAAF